MAPKPQGLAPLTPFATMGLIVSCLGVYGWQFSLNPHEQMLVIYRLGVIPSVLFHHEILHPALAPLPANVTPLTALFLHSDWLHVTGNMLYLWIFGHYAENAMGHGRFVAFYLLAGIGAVLAQALADPALGVPMIGASGAISGVLGAYLLLYPRGQIMIVIPLGPKLQVFSLPALGILGVWLLLQVASTLLPAAEGDVAFLAHLGGFACGMLLVPFFLRPGMRLFNRPPQ